MGDQRAADEVRAAGAVVWRPAGRGAQVAVVHRPKFDDWTFAKGKVDPGEHVLLGAVREVAEETGLPVTLGRRLPEVRYSAAGAVKRVDYWVATVRATDAAAGFAANAEIDQLVWLAASTAGARLSYPRDAQTLREFRTGPRRTSPMILVRHATAGSKSAWHSDDASRPLDSPGKRDAKLLAALLKCFGDCRVLSSPAERCVATVRPYAAWAGTSVEVEAALDVTEGGDSAPGGVAAKTAAQLAADEQPIVLCAHRENLPMLIEAACAQLGAAAPADRPLRKGEFVVLHRAGGRLAGIERHHSSDVG
ncbi:MAG: NUDIX hydrolase [Streptosporangiaceae bacterium]